MALQVQYENYHFYFVASHALDKLLARKKVRRFYRPSEKRWVDVSRDPIRGSGGRYSGPERRQFK